MEIVQQTLCSELVRYGFEIHPFKIGWYNEKVEPGFHLSYPEDTLAFCVISTPSMFDKAFLPFVERLRERSSIENRDPVDSCVAEHLQKAKEVLSPDHEVDIIQDFEMHPATRRPKLLVQTAGHVSGAAYYYKKEDVSNSPWPLKKKIYGVSLHPNFGGWFAFRGAIIIKDLTCSYMPRTLPPKLLTSDDDIVDLLERFNNNWRDGTYRDVIPVEERYSDEQIRYWDTAPSKRFALLGLEDKLEGKLGFRDLHEILF
ncbi:cyanocobalamin reductase / alkylcobalamin dealkylase-like [Diadema antillarum]|uniref:cyanocobalamin reductase / alkylcobalamin dealkylase-like n=1 Tax=Diadema antillarum TaxID=105358 RepID=UPI003A85BA5B